ncbi:MAG: hypothetical protein ACO35R_07280, partial [Burkholderiaceae bacterium]
RGWPLAPVPCVFSLMGRAGWAATVFCWFILPQPGACFGTTLVHNVVFGPGLWGLCAALGRNRPRTGVARLVQ